MLHAELIKHYAADPKWKSYGYWRVFLEGGKEPTWWITANPESPPDAAGITWRFQKAVQRIIRVPNPLQEEQEWERIERESAAAHGGIRVIGDLCWHDHRMGGHR